MRRWAVAAAGAAALVAGGLVLDDVLGHKPCPSNDSACPAAGHLDPSTYHSLLKLGAALLILGAVLVVAEFVRAG